MHYKFNTIYDGSDRGPYGDVEIVTEKIFVGDVRETERQTAVGGLIVPFLATTGRKAAKEPSSGIRISATKDLPKKCLVSNPRNTGKVDMDKGHIMALELGGPDVSHNIVPQYSQLQRNGKWRRMETRAYDLAIEADNANSALWMSILISYIDTESYFRSLVPAFFRVELRELHYQGRLIEDFHIENKQDKTDQFELFKKDPEYLAEGHYSFSLDEYIKSGWRSQDNKGLQARQQSTQLIANWYNSKNVDEGSDMEWSDS